MIKEINYKGVTETPSDYECPDGELSVSMNAIAYGQGVKPILPPKKVLGLEKDYEELIYVHQTSKFKHYIVVQLGNSLSWVEINNGVRKSVGFSQELGTIDSVSAIGNTLLVLTDRGMYYFLWKNDFYVELGTHLPELGLKFGLVGTAVTRQHHSYRKDEWIQSCVYVPKNRFDEDAQKQYTSEVMANVNKFINEEATEKDKFMFPFFVRYAYRLYDGSLTMHSAPILMTPTLTDAPMAYLRLMTIDGGNEHVHLDYSVGAMVCDLHMLAEHEAKETLKNWGDIVKSVDIFVSKPLYTHDQSGKITGFANIDENEVNFIGRDSSEYGTLNANVSLGPVPGKEVYDWIQDIDGFKCHKANPFIKSSDFNNSTRTLWRKRNIPNSSQILWDDCTYLRKFELPEKSFDEEVENASQFFLIKSVLINEIPVPLGKQLLKDLLIRNQPVPNPYQKVELKKGTLKSLVNREAMTDDYDSHDKVTPKFLYVYNSRLNMANIVKDNFKGFSLGHCMQHTSPLKPNETSDGRIDVNVSYIADKGGKKLIYKGGVEHFAPYMRFPYLYHPDPDVVMAIVGMEYLMFKFPMKRHKFLNGSFCFSMSDMETETDLSKYGQLVPYESAYPNKVYTSEVNNPFFFPVRNINTIGTGEIRGLSSSTRAISSGQFGQFPMYAFTSEGVWALEVSSTGGFSAKQPVTRDVCNNPSSITQLDNAVLFTSDRGIMMISGGDSTCISQVLDSPEPFSLSSLPKADKLHYVDRIGKDAFKNIPFKEYLKGARFAFDYVGQRIVAFNPERRFAYMFSMESKAWGMMGCDWERTINCYPSALVQNSDGNIYDLTQEDLDYVEREDPVNALLVTRPLKLDDADALKTIDTIIQRGKFERNDVSSILYGSRDLYNWFPVWSSANMYMRGFRGTPYKYYRLVIGCSLANDSRVSGCTIQYSVRQGNQPR